MEESNPMNYLFVHDMSQIRIPLLPSVCFDCQSADEVDIQLIDEQHFGNRTVQRIKIFLTNFEIEDSSYICLMNVCPILVEYGSDSIVLNITSTLFSHVFLSLVYSNHSVMCTIQTRFAIFLSNQSLTCTKEIHLHPRWNNRIFGQFVIHDCRANLFEKSIYEKSFQFHPISISIKDQNTSLKPSENPCEYLLQNTIDLENISTVQRSELLTTITLYSLYNPWIKDVQIVGSCRTQLTPYRHMFFTDDVVHHRDMIIEQGKTVEISCPIDGSQEYLKYVWYYQKYQPKYQISNNRTILLSNITEKMQGKYMCVGDDGNENLEFEMTLQVLNHRQTNSDSLNSIIMLILISCLILSCIILTLIICYLLKNSSSSIESSIEKRNSLIVHHDVIVTIQQEVKSSLWNQAPYHTLDYIDKPSMLYHHVSSSHSIDISSRLWRRQSNTDLRQQKLPYQFSTRHRNVNGQPLTTQLSLNIPLLRSNSDTNIPVLVKFHQISNSINNSLHELQQQQQHNDMDVLQTFVPVINQYSSAKSTKSNRSFDSQNELDDFNQMRYVCVDEQS